tara:strand:- start:47 stop:997 length:951 start_codon:yes stop_codon:yes gene_type:complete
VSPEEYYKIFGEWPHGYPSARPSYPSKFTELLATNPVTKFLVPGAERFLQRGQNPSFMDIIFAGLGVTPVGRLIPGQIRSALSKGTPVFHGTSKRFNRPNPEMLGRNFEPAYGEGFNVTGSPEIANLYGRTSVRGGRPFRWGPFSSLEGSGGVTKSGLPVQPYYVNEYRIPKDAKFLNLDKKLKDQPKDVKDSIISKMLSQEKRKGDSEATLKSVADDYGNWPLGDIYFIKFSKGTSMIPSTHQGVKYTDEMFGFDKGGWKNEWGQLESGMPVHPFSPSMYKSGQTSYVIKPESSIFDTLKPIRKKLKLEFDTGLN